MVMMRVSRAGCRSRGLGLSRPREDDQDDGRQDHDAPGGSRAGPSVRVRGPAEPAGEERMGPTGRDVGGDHAVEKETTECEGTPAECAEWREAP